MIKGLCITPPVLGRISIGSVIEKNGKRLPVKEDFFTITTNIQGKDGWIKHPLNDEIIKASGQDKLRAIPIRLLFNEPDLNLRAEYNLFDRKTGRPLCVGNGETCRRYTETGMQTLTCPSPDHCDLATGGQCKPYGRLNVQVSEQNELGTFIFRTTGFNSIRSLTARLCYYQAVSGNALACLPLELRLRGKSTTMSHRSAIYYVDLTVRDGMTLEDAISCAIATDEKRKASGYDQAALDAAARAGFKNGAFEEDSDEIASVVEEFFTEVEPAQMATSANLSIGVKEKLEQKLSQIKLPEKEKASFSTEPLG